MTKAVYYLTTTLTLAGVGCAETQTPAAFPTEESEPTETGPAVPRDSATATDSAPNTASSADVKAAVAVAESWLALVDQGEYAQTWDTAASVFKQATKRDEWPKLIASARDPLGKLLSRQLQAAEYTTSLPGVPEGEYVVVQFNSSFQKKEQAVELVSPMREADGTWRVSGYFIK